MIVCVCHRMSESAIKSTMAIYDISTFEDLQDYTNIATSCGRCSECVRGIVEQENQLRASVMEARWAHNPEDTFDSLATQPNEELK